MASVSWKRSKNAVPVAVAVSVGPGKESKKEGKRQGIVYASAQFDPPAHAIDAYGTSDTKERTLEVKDGCVFEPVIAGKPGSRDIVAIIGPSGSGKSHVIKQMAENYRRMYPDRPRFLISSLDEDDTLDEIDLTRVDDEVLAADVPTDIYQWSNSLVIIDDVEGFPKPKREAVQALQDLIATQGRHSETSLLRAQHVLDDRVVNRHLLHEATSFVLFPAHSGTVIPLLKKFAGLTKSQAESVANLRTRWVQVHHTVPKFTLTTHNITIL
jgi:energy-coupling factor transporter ATP-binding protein EcfA2